MVSFVEILEGPKVRSLVCVVSLRAHSNRHTPLIKTASTVSCTTNWLEFSFDTKWPFGFSGNKMPTPIQSLTCYITIFILFRNWESWGGYNWWYNLIWVCCWGESKWQPIQGFHNFDWKTCSVITVFSHFEESPLAWHFGKHEQVVGLLINLSVYSTVC